MILKNIFAEKIGKKIGIFGLKFLPVFLQELDHNIFFAENWQKSQKIVIITLTPGYWTIHFLPQNTSSVGHWRLWEVKLLV
jgi:hypothetical protein